MPSELSPTREVCEGCGVVAEGREFRSGDEASYNPARMCWGARWSAAPPGWLTAYDAGGEHWVCSVACARKVDTAERARQVLASDDAGDGQE